MRETRGGWGETPPPFPSRAGLDFTFNKFPLRTLSESLAQATPKRANIHWKKGPSRRGLTSSSAMRGKLRAKRGIFEETGSHVGFLGR